MQTFRLNIFLFLTLPALALAQQTKPFDENEYYSDVYAQCRAKYDFDRWNQTGQEGFYRWQSEFRAELKHLIGYAGLERKYMAYRPTAQFLNEEDCGTFVRQRWSLKTEPNFSLPIVVLIPKHLQGKSPLVIAVQGHSQNSEQYAGVYKNEEDSLSAVDGERNIGIQAVMEGYVAIVPTTRAFGETRFVKDRNQDKLSSCAQYSHRDLLVGRTIVGDRVWDISKLIDWAYENLPVDKTNTIITGNSGGGTVNIYAGAIDTRVSMSLPGSAFCPFAESIGLLFHCDCNYNPGILKLGDMQDIAGLTAPRIFRAIHGKEDPIFPIQATREGMRQLSKIYAAAGAEGRCSIYEGPEGHRYYKDGAWNFIKENLEQPRPNNIITAPEASFKFEPLEMFVHPAKDFPITRYGARKGNIAATTNAFRKAIAACNKAGGGRIVVPEGEWLAGPVELKSYCHLYLGKGARLRSPLISACECNNVAITGPGIVEAEPDSQRHSAFVEFKRCSNVQLADFHLGNSPVSGMQLYLCKDVWIHGLDIISGGDGIGVDMTQRAVIEGCSFRQSGDAIVFNAVCINDDKTSVVPTSDIVVRRCIIVKGGSIVAVGDETSAGVQRIYAHHCTGADISTCLKIRNNETRGGFIENVTVEDCVSDSLQEVVNLETGTDVSRISCRNISANRAEKVYNIAGSPEKRIRGVSLSHIDIGEVSIGAGRADNVDNLQMNDML